MALESDQWSIFTESDFLVTALGDLRQITTRSFITFITLSNFGIFNLLYMMVIFIRDAICHAA